MFFFRHHETQPLVPCTNASSPFAARERAPGYLFVRDVATCVYFGNDGKHILVVFSNLAEPEQNVYQLVVDGVQLLLRHLLPVVVAAQNKVNKRWADIQNKGEGEKMQR